MKETGFVRGQELETWCPGPSGGQLAVVWYQKDFRATRAALFTDKFEFIPYKTHEAVAVRLLEANHEDLTYLCDRLYHDFQDEVWSPDGEDRRHIEMLGPTHTSMSAGDVIEFIEETGSRFFLCDRIGWRELKRQ